jgi:hypothetical protein
MEIEIESLARFKPTAEKELTKMAKASLQGFFACHNNPPRSVRLIALEATRGGDRRCLVKITPRPSDGKHHSPGLRVLIYTEGTQGLRCDMTAAGYSEQELERLIAEGPYLRPSANSAGKSEKKDVPTVTTPVLAAPQPVPDTLVETSPPAEAPAAQPIVERRTRRSALLPQKGPTPLERLQARKIPEADIDRLRQTRSSTVR